MYAHVLLDDMTYQTVEDKDIRNFDPEDYNKFKKYFIKNFKQEALILIIAG